MSLKTNADQFSGRTKACALFIDVIARPMTPLQYLAP